MSHKQLFLDVLMLSLLVTDDICIKQPQAGQPVSVHCHAAQVCGLACGVFVCPVNAGQLLQMLLPSDVHNQGCQLLWTLHPWAQRGLL